MKKYLTLIIVFLSLFLMAAQTQSELTPDEFLKVKKLVMEKGVPYENDPDLKLVAWRVNISNIHNIKFEMSYNQKLGIIAVSRTEDKGGHGGIMSFTFYEQTNEFSFTITFDKLVDGGNYKIKKKPSSKSRTADELIKAVFKELENYGLIEKK
jgi:hypothetical protein